MPVTAPLALTSVAKTALDSSFDLSSWTSRNFLQDSPGKKIVSSKKRCIDKLFLMRIVLKFQLNAARDHPDRGDVCSRLRIKRIIRCHRKKVLPLQVDLAV